MNAYALPVEADYPAGTTANDIDAQANAPKCWESLSEPEQSAIDNKFLDAWGMTLLTELEGRMDASEVMQCVMRYRAMLWDFRNEEASKL